MLHSSDVDKTFDFKKEIFEREKYLLTDRAFFSEPTYSASRDQQSEETIQQYKQNLLSDEIEKICDSIQFFSQNLYYIDEEIIRGIFSNINKDFDISDCISGFINSIHKRKIFLCNPEFSQLLVDCIIEFSMSNQEDQDFSAPEQEFKIKSYEALSNFIFVNSDIAIYLCQKGFFNFCLPIFMQLIQSLMNEDSSQEDNINTHFALIESLLRIFCSLFNHSEIITPEYSNQILKLLQVLLSLDKPDLNLRIKTFALDNIYWFAFSAPDEVLQALLTPEFVQTILMLLETDYQVEDDITIPVKLSVFQAIERITLHGEPFSLFFVQDEFNILQYAQNWTEWSEDTRFTFLTILRNFTTISDLTPTIQILESAPIMDLIDSILENSPFNCKKEACIVICHIFMYNQAPFTTYLLTRFARFFNKLTSMIDKTRPDYLARVALSAVLVSLSFLETQDAQNYQQFIEMIQQDDWLDIFESLTECEDENLSNLCTQINAHIDQ